MKKRKALHFLLAAAALLFSCAALFLPDAVLAQSITLDLGENAVAGGGGGSMAGRVVQLVALMTVLSLAPSILVMMTSFTRIVIVLSFLRTAMGTQQTPPNSVLISLALFLTFFIMSPTLTAAYEDGIAPLVNNQIEEVQAFERTTEPFKKFMLKNVREKDLELFLGIAEKRTGLERVEEAMDTPLQVLIPAFMISELRRAFEIGFLLFLPFLVIDMVTASILMSMGMMMLPPVMIALPFKIIFFVLVDGWYLVAGSLLQSYSG
ncbi:MAG: flagellar type III secretion system pore protein FliP [Pseudomonadota bacterium]|jgi:flagellar biosynthetic protein FliP|nr:flagellar biosynthetic protein FliP [Pseudomonadota bacterium]QKK06458.1 MAG: flagellar type III secretion system pore protein FliP [Pseudomonadota bacterium]